MSVCPEDSLAAVLKRLIFQLLMFNFPFFGTLFQDSNVENIYNSMTSGQTQRDRVM